MLRRLLLDFSILSNEAARFSIISSGKVVTSNILTWFIAGVDAAVASEVGVFVPLLAPGIGLVLGGDIGIRGIVRRNARLGLGFR
mmetsp:Transcript_3135/g.5302  ORF Transcript_3135/g.5302 Transcript_3135/m.5302 type:complete len:85 (+) Transcript_3135:317-571(+)